MLVAIAPEPLLLIILTVGTTVYPIPGFMTKILSIELPVWPERLVIIATAVAFIPPEEEVLIETIGVERYPVPSLIKSILDTELPPTTARLDASSAVADADVAPEPTIISFVIYPKSFTDSSTSSILVLITSFAS